jgi:hypothetical protein
MSRVGYEPRYGGSQPGSCKRPARQLPTEPTCLSFPAATRVGLALTVGLDSAFLLQNLAAFAFFVR